MHAGFSGIVSRLSKLHRPHTITSSSKHSSSKNVEKFREKNVENLNLVAIGRHSDAFSGVFNVEIYQNVFEEFLLSFRFCLQLVL